jgi:putative SOS response-associated peptidase YedK
VDDRGQGQQRCSAKGDQCQSGNSLKGADVRQRFSNGSRIDSGDRFFEWDCSKQRHLFTFDEPLFAFGGIARDCEIKGETRRCGVVITTVANDVVKPIHEKGRMPVVIHKYDYKRWLDPETPFDELRRMTAPLPNEETHVEKADEPEKQDSAQGSLF